MDQDQAPGAREELKLTEAPIRLTLLRDWSTWLVGLQTGALALITFFVGDGGSSYFDDEAARAAISVAVACFAGSTVSATFLLGQLPSIRKRMGLRHPGLRIDPHEDDFYQKPAWEKAPGRFIRLSWLATLEHWLFVGGIVGAGVALILQVWEG